MATHKDINELRSSINDERNSMSEEEMQALLASAGLDFTSIKQSIVSTLVGLGIYAVVCTLGLWATLALAALITNAFFCMVVLIFGIAASMYLSSIVAAASTPFVLHYGSKGAAAIGTGYTNTKNWITSKFKSSTCDKTNDELVAG